MALNYATCYGELAFFSEKMTYQTVLSLHEIDQAEECNKEENSFGAGKGHVHPGSGSSSYRGKIRSTWSVFPTSVP